MFAYAKKKSNLIPFVNPHPQVGLAKSRVRPRWEAASVTLVQTISALVTAPVALSAKPPKALFKAAKVFVLARCIEP